VRAGARERDREREKEKRERWWKEKKRETRTQEERERVAAAPRERAQQPASSAGCLPGIVLVPRAGRPVKIDYGHCGNFVVREAGASKDRLLLRVCCTWVGIQRSSAWLSLI
jgi:hypothetical protein